MEEKDGRLYLRAMLKREEGEWVLEAKPIY